MELHRSSLLIYHMLLYEWYINNTFYFILMQNETSFGITEYLDKRLLYWNKSQISICKTRVPRVCSLWVNGTSHGLSGYYRRPCSMCWNAVKCRKPYRILTQGLWYCPPCMVAVHDVMLVPSYPEHQLYFAIKSSSHILFWRVAWDSVRHPSFAIIFSVKHSWACGVIACQIN